MTTPDKIYYCYKATNTDNGKIYIGFATEPQKRWRQHKADAIKGRGYIFHSAIRKHGWDAFIFEVICCGLDKRAMLEHVEPALIEQYQSNIGQNGYNMRKKVLGCLTNKIRPPRPPVSAETKQKLRIASTGNQYAKGIKHSAETNQKKSFLLRGNKRSLGYKHTSQSCQEISAASQKMWDGLTEEQRLNRVTQLVEKSKSTRIQKGTVLRPPAQIFNGNPCVRCQSVVRYKSTRSCVLCAQRKYATTSK